MLLFKFIKSKSSFILSFGELALIAPHATPTRAREKKNWMRPYDYLHRGVTYFQLKNYTAALADFEKQLTVYKQLADTYYYMGLVHEAQGSPAKAKEYLQQAYEKYTSTGFHCTDPYSVTPDQVFLLEIERKRK
jgi:tetratricopeptide (TPR) repeat protein